MATSVRLPHWAFPCHTWYSTKKMPIRAMIRSRWRPTDSRRRDSTVAPMREPANKSDAKRPPSEKSLDKKCETPSQMRRAWKPHQVSVPRRLSLCEVSIEQPSSTLVTDDSLSAGSILRICGCDRQPLHVAQCVGTAARERGTIAETDNEKWHCVVAPASLESR